MDAKMMEIDVSECKYCRKDKGCDIWGIPCQMKEFCYFKTLKQENAKLKEKYQEELTVNTQLRERKDEDLRQIAQLEKDLDLFRQAHDNEQAQRRLFEQKLEKIKEIVKCSKEPMNCSNCPMREECEELCANDENLQDIILQIIEGVEDE